MKYTFILLLVLVLIDALPSFFYSPEQNNNPLPSFYKKGVYHVHSIYSDGKGTVDEIYEAAEGAKLDFVVLTDHGRPNVKCASSTAFKGNVLMVGASELSLNCGHLCGVGFETPEYIFPPEPQEAIDELVKEQKGAAYIAHPFDDKITWTDWDIEKFTGIELINSYSEARRAGVLNFLLFPLKYWINSRYALLVSMAYPSPNVAKWDDLNMEANALAQCYGIFALDVHAKMKVTKNFALNFPTYRAMFEVMNVYIKIKGSWGRDADKAELDVVDALKEGKFFNAVEGIAPANGFDAFFMRQGDGKRMEMGEVSLANNEAGIAGKMVLETPFDFATEIFVFKNGKPFKHIEENKNKRVEIEVKEAGVYRAELRVPGNSFDDLPWIICNPFFIGMRGPGIDDRDLKRLAIAATRPVPEDIDNIKFKVEKNEISQVELQQIVTNHGHEQMSLKFRMRRDGPGNKDYWGMMALRKDYDFSKFNGFAFEVAGNQKMRLWLEFRAGKGNKDGAETWFRHSFLVTRKMKKVIIPFDKFYPYLGKKQKANAVKHLVRSIFLGVNNAIAYAGSDGYVAIESFGVF